MSTDEVKVTPSKGDKLAGKFKDVGQFIIRPGQPRVPRVKITHIHKLDETSIREVSKQLLHALQSLDPATVERWTRSRTDSLRRILKFRDETGDETSSFTDNSRLEFDPQSGNAEDNPTDLPLN